MKISIFSVLLMIAGFAHADETLTCGGASEACMQLVYKDSSVTSWSQAAQACSNQ